MARAPHLLLENRLPVPLIVSSRKLLQPVSTAALAMPPLTDENIPLYRVLPVERTLPLLVSSRLLAPSLVVVEEVVEEDVEDVEDVFRL